MDSLCMFPAYYRERDTTTMSKKGKSKLRRFLNNPWFVSISCSLIVYFGIQLPMEAKINEAVHTSLDNYFTDNNLIVVNNTDAVGIETGITNNNSSEGEQTNVNVTGGNVSISQAGTVNIYPDYQNDERLRKMAGSFHFSVAENGEAVEADLDAVPSETDTAMEELKNQRVLMTYEWEGAEYYFLGQLDDSGQWDGDCILNVYMDDVLWIITEGRFDSGIMVSRRQVYNQNSGSWDLSDRKVEKDGSLSGESWSYSYLPFPQGFVREDVTEQNIKTYRDFERWLEEEGLVYNKYYSGSISYSDSDSGITYNDDTGKAYYVKYFDNGNIRTLYVGRFRNGDFEDDTGDAFWISKKTMEQTVYVYFKGRFVAGNPVEEDLKAENMILAMSQAQIDEKLVEAEAVVGEPLQCRLDGLLTDT